jgi:hypothetical protein
MIEIVEREIATCDLREAVNKFIPEAISKEIEKVSAGIYPLQVSPDTHGQLASHRVALQHILNTPSPMPLLCSLSVFAARTQNPLHILPLHYATNPVPHSLARVLLTHTLSDTRTLAQRVY